VPKYLTCGFILEEGLETDELERIVQSMAQAAREAGVMVIAGDTKVIGGSGGVYINTAGVGFFAGSVEPSLRAANCREGDRILLSGTLGDHHAAILSARMNISNSIQSDCAPLHQLTAALTGSGVKIRSMRDVTRGGLATVLHEIAAASARSIRLQETQIPVSAAVRGFCGILGLDPLYMGNEGKMIAVVAKEDAPKALACMRADRYGHDASIIGEVTGEAAGSVLLHTLVGGIRILPELYGEGLPRIC
jgi:hydrogenase expression/formation protein HypE